MQLFDILISDFRTYVLTGILVTGAKLNLQEFEVVVTVLRRRRLRKLLQKPMQYRRAVPQRASASASPLLARLDPTTCSCSSRLCHLAGLLTTTLPSQIRFLTLSQRSFAALVHELASVDCDGLP